MNSQTREPKASAVVEKEAELKERKKKLQQEDDTIPDWVRNALAGVLFVVFVIASGILVKDRWNAQDEPEMPDSMWYKKLSARQLPASQLDLQADVAKRDAVREAIQWSWAGYEKCAWGSDELQPLSCSGVNLTSTGAIGYTIIDGLDTLLIAGLNDEYKRSAAWCRANLNFDRDGNFNTFETTIRVLGGLLATHYLASLNADPEIKADAPFFLERATDIGDRLLGAFSSPSGLPLSDINLHTRVGSYNGYLSLAEVATLQLELKYLSHLTEDEIYWQKAERVMEVIKADLWEDSVQPIFMQASTGKFVNSDIRLGSRGDSYYEYLLKQYLQTNRQEPVYRDMYDDAMTGIKKKLVARTKKSNLIFTRELHPPTHNGGWTILDKQDHLVCFLGGSLLLGITEGGHRDIDWNNLNVQDNEDFVVGTGLIESCVNTYQSASGLGSEIVMFVGPDASDSAANVDWYVKDSGVDMRYILRPETVESLFLAWRTTGDQKYRDWGWQIFNAFQKQCRVSTGGYANIKDVRVNPAEKEDRMETFWVAETLKYLYLLFDDGDSIGIDSHVFNTEAHPLPVFTPRSLTAFSTS